MIERVISGGQTGADLAGWRAARAAGIATGGWMVGNYWTEEGDRPEFAQEYGAAILNLGYIRFGAQLRRRALANVRDADGTLCFDEADSDATDNAHEDCVKHGKPFRCVMLGYNRCGNISASIATHDPEDIVDWIRQNGIRTLNVCGNRESRSPGIGAWVESYMIEVFRLLRDP